MVSLVVGRYLRYLPTTKQSHTGAPKFNLNAGNQIGAANPERHSQKTPLYQLCKGSEDMTGGLRYSGTESTETEKSRKPSHTQARKHKKTTIVDP